MGTHSLAIALCRHLSCQSNVLQVSVRHGNIHKKKVRKYVCKHSKVPEVEAHYLCTQGETLFKQALAQWDARTKMSRA